MMDTNNLKTILEGHKKWLADDGGKRADLHEADLTRADLREADLTRANLTGADLTRADLTRADLREADLREANLHGADLDYSAWPLWCGSTKAKLDDRQVIQLLYHAMCVVGPNNSKEVRAVRNDKKVMALMRKFHRLPGCGGKVEPVPASGKDEGAGEGKEKKKDGNM